MLHVGGFWFQKHACHVLLCLLSQAPQIQSRQTSRVRRVEITCGVEVRSPDVTLLIRVLTEMLEACPVVAGLKYPTTRYM